MRGTDVACFISTKQDIYFLTINHDIYYLVLFFWVCEKNVDNGHVYKKEGSRSIWHGITKFIIINRNFDVSSDLMDFFPSCGNPPLSEIHAKRLIIYTIG
jgi:hypothetical protein